MNDHVRILHICETIKGGPATYLDTFETLCSRHYDSTYIVPQEHADQLPSTMHILPYARPKRGIVALCRMLHMTLKAMRQLQPNVVICHSTFSLLALTMLRLCVTPAVCIYIPHGWARLRYGKSGIKATITAWVEGTLAGLADVVLNISKNDKALAERHRYLGQHVVVENALADRPMSHTTSPFQPVQNRINLVFAGRMDRQKGLDILLDAFTTAARQRPELHLHVVGAPVDTQDVNGHITHPQVTYHGWIPPTEMDAFYAHADMLVMASRWEGLPMVLIAALRAGTPVLIADTCEQGELIAGSGAGISIPLEKDAFTQVLQTLHATTLAGMRIPARQHYKTRFGAERFERETQAVIDVAISHQSARRQRSQIVSQHVH